MSRISWIQNFLKNKNFNKVLDIGCGNGKRTKILAEHLNLKNVIGIDIDLERLKTAKNSSNRILPVLGSGEQLPFKDESFDLVVSLEVIEHLATPIKFLREIYRVLEKGGLFILSTPNAHSLIYILRNFIKNNWIDNVTNHLNMFDRFTFYRLCKKVGFQYLSYDYTNFYIGKWRINILSHIPLIKNASMTLMFAVKK